MPQELHFKASLELVSNIDLLKQEAVKQSQYKKEKVQGVVIKRLSLDARKRPIHYQVRAFVYTHEEEMPEERKSFAIATSFNQTCHIIGFGPAGIFAALQCIEQGIKPIVIERGKDVKKRLADISAIHKKGTIDTNSNYCFGEGGAGTYSDGKLYTRSSKRGDVKKVLDTFIEHGAKEEIAYQAHPHIGTNKLPRIIEKMRLQILERGGEIHFEQQVVDFKIKNNQINRIVCASGEEFDCEQVLLATGHSARNIFELLDRKKIEIEAKPFALGLRIEHHQSLIDKIQYKQERGDLLPPASYNLVTQTNDRGVFSFCMCPGGVIAPSGTKQNEIVVNGWSSSARNGQFSNSGLVVEVKPENWQQYGKEGALAALAFQAKIEKDAYKLTNSLVAPAQRVEDFIQNKVSRDLPRTSYTLGIESHNLGDLLPQFITTSLRQGLINFGKKMHGYRTNEAVLVGVESRTSSPVRIPRDRETLRHPQIKNLFPCGEGAGYAGGIVSAALDGMRCVLQMSN